MLKALCANSVFSVSLWFFQRVVNHRDTENTEFAQRIIILLLLLIVPASVYALDPNRSLSEFGNQVWLTENGLPQNTVQAILQTRDGYLWIGTQEGLARFNGTSFVIFDKANTPQLKSNDIRALLEDRSGTLWIGTSYGLVRMQSGKFTSFTTAEGLPDNSVGPLAQGIDGSVWIATGAGLVRYANNSFVASNTLAGLNLDNIQTLFQDTAGILWIGNADGVSSLKDRNVFNSKPTAELARRSVSAIVQDKTGRLWFGTNSGLISFDGDRVLTLTTKNGLPDDHINYLTADRDGSVWIGTSGGLARLRVDGSLTLAVAEGLSSNLILSVCEDREGSLWIGTESGGLNVLRNKKFTTFTTKQGLTSDLVKTIYQDRSGAVWIGTNGGGLNVLENGKFKAYSSKDGLASNVVLSLFGDDKGSLWIGTPDGLSQFKDGTFKTFTVAEGLSSDFVRSIYVDRSGTVWAGTRSGLNKIQDGVFTIYTTRDGLANDFIGAIFEDSRGDLWVGTRAGLSHLKDGRFTNFTTKDGLSSDVVTSLHQDRNGDIWIGTNGGGLNRLRGGHFVSYTTRNGLLDDVIYRILEDGEQNLWLSSPKGVFKLSLRDLNDFADGRSQYLNTTSYGTSDGMLTRECSGGGYPAAWKGNDGRLWFSTVKGIAMIDPSRIQFNSQAPAVAIEQVRVDDQPISLDNGIRLSPATTRLDFYFAAMSFVAPDKVRFKYRLEGFDPDWIDGGTRRAAFYTNLRPGNYTFRVIASNNDGVWNEQGAAFQFYLRPRFYQTYWFYGLLIVGLALVAWQLYQFRVRRIRAQFAAVLAERTRIAREIHDNLAQEMLGISVQLEVLARTMPPDAEVAKGHLDRVRTLVRHGIAEARRYVWDLRSQALEGADLPKALSETARRLTAPTTIEAQVQVGGTFRPLATAVEENLLRIGQEAINNAVKHAQPKHILVNLTFDTSKVQLSVRDDGRGFNEANVETNGHFGLIGMRERAKQIGANLRVISTLGTGTEVVVDVPVSA
jgi:ligand-binding sensor domain-containing protein/signal transduction histidine kinase